MVSVIFVKNGFKNLFMNKVSIAVILLSSVTILGNSSCIVGASSTIVDTCSIIVFGS